MTEQLLSPCFVYRFFDDDDRLLYVGVAADVGRRIAQHRVTASWWPEATRGEFRCYPSREAALQAEALAIAVERPGRNLVRPHVREDRAAELSPAEQTRLVTELERAQADVAASRSAMWRAEGERDTARRRLGEVTAERDDYRRRYWDRERVHSAECVSAFLRGRAEALITVETEAGDW